MSPELNLKFECPKCGEDLEAETSMIGECYDCPACGQQIEVPDSNQAPEPTGTSSGLHMEEESNFDAELTHKV